jgi:hypothetical protein
MTEELLARQHNLWQANSLSRLGCLYEGARCTVGKSSAKNAAYIRSSCICIVTLNVGWLMNA